MRTYTNKQRVKNFLTAALLSFGSVTGAMFLFMVNQQVLFLNASGVLAIIVLGLGIFFGAWRFGSGIGAGLLTGLLCCGLSGFALCTAGFMGVLGNGVH